MDLGTRSTVENRFRAWSCHQRVEESVVARVPAEHPTRSDIDVLRDPVQIPLGEAGQVGLFWRVLGNPQ